MSTRTLRVLVAASVLALATTASAQQRFTTPLPPDSRVVPPASNAPAAMAAFSGKWAGPSEHGYRAGLVVEQIMPPNAIVVYSQADVPNIKPGWERVYGQFVSGKLVVQLPRPATVTYTMRKDGRLDMVYQWMGGSETAVLTKVTR